MIDTVFDYDESFINFSPEDSGSMFLRNAGIHLQVHMVSRAKIPPSIDLEITCSCRSLMIMIKKINAT